MFTHAQCFSPDAKQDTIRGSLNPNQVLGTNQDKKVQDNQPIRAQIQTLFSFTSPELSTVMITFSLVFPSLAISKSYFVGLLKKPTIKK